jgi:hypothetical protein
VDADHLPVRISDDRQQKKVSGTNFHAEKGVRQKKVSGTNFHGATPCSPPASVQAPIAALVKGLRPAEPARCACP